MKKSRRTVLASRVVAKTGWLAPAVFAIACGAGQPDATSSTPSEVLRRVIGIAGGSIVMADGSKIEVPPGALQQDTLISMTPMVSVPSAAAGAGAAAGTTWLMAPEGQTFTRPVTITLAFDPSSLDSFETADDVIVYTSPQTSPRATIMNTDPVDASHVAVQTSHFSYFSPRHRVRMFGLGTDAPTALAARPLENELAKGWRSKDGHTLQSARRVFNIDNVDLNPDNQNLKLLAEANAESVTSRSCNATAPTAASRQGVSCDTGSQTCHLAGCWANDARQSLASLQSWVSAVKSGGLMPIVAVAVTRFDPCLEHSPLGGTRGNLSKCEHGKHSSTSMIDHTNFKNRFRYLLEAFPDVRAWGFINEPDAAGFDAADAVSYYVDGASVLAEEQHKRKSRGVSTFIGEFAFVWSVKKSQEYWSSYEDALLKVVASDHVSFPHHWGFHPYKDTTGNKPSSNPAVLSPDDRVRFDTDGTSAYLAFIDGLEKKAKLAKGTLRVWLTETGTMLEWSQNACADSRDNEAQYAGAKQIYKLSAMDRVDRVYWWQFQQAACDWGGDWDSSMVDWNGLPRPAFYALIGEPDAYPGVSVSRDCGGPGKSTNAHSTCMPSVCCALCSKQAQSFSTYDPASSMLDGSCSLAAAAFCGANQDRGSVQSSGVGFCAPLPEPAPAPSCGALASGGVIDAPHEIVSCNRRYWLILEATGKLLEVHFDVGTVWDQVGPAGDHLEMQGDGNLVLYSSSGSVAWASNTAGNPGAYLELQDDGALLITLGATPVCSIYSPNSTAVVPKCP